MSATRLLRVRCSTWEQVEAFYRRKLRRSGRLSMKVPFDCEIGTPVTLGLELPNQIVISIDGTVAIAHAPAGGRTAIDVSLYGLSPDLLARLEAMVADARSLATTSEDAGLDEERRLLAAREGDLRRTRRLAAHEILGVPRDPNAAELRAAWTSLARREHPDGVARFGSAALSSVAEEAMIVAARAFDRLRNAVAADGRGSVVGATVRSPSSWAAADEGGAGFFAEALTPPVEDGVELVDHSGSHRVPSPDAFDEIPTKSTPSSESRRRIALAEAEAARQAAAEPEAPPPLPLPPPELLAEPVPTPQATPIPPPSTVGLDDLLPPIVTPAPNTHNVSVRWTPGDLFADLDLGPATAGAAPIAVEASLAQARSGPGDRFIRQIRAKLGAGDHAGAQEVAEAALHLYGADRRLRGLYHVAAAMAACARADRFGAVAALETALAHDPACLEAATALDQLRRAGVPSAPAIQRLFS